MASSRINEEITHAAVVSDRRKAGLRFGLIAGASFALGAWGIDAAGLLQSHALIPWLKLVLGLVVALPVGSLAGWLAVRLGKTL